MFCLNKFKQLNIVEGIPLCPLTKESFKSEGSCKGKNRILSFKFTCPKSRRDKQCKRYHAGENPCTDKKSDRITYQNLKSCPHFLILNSTIIYKFLKNIQFQATNISFTLTIWIAIIRAQR